jgi:acyl-CoA thioester hydrolase
MEHVFLEMKVMWSQIDANMHLRHSAYADFAAQARLEILEQMGFGGEMLAKLRIGPILFREELLYKREVRPGQTVKVTCELSKCRTDGARWSFRQMIYRDDNVLAAQINVDGAWIDMNTRKLTGLPDEITARFLTLPRTEDFALEPAKEQQS